MMSRCETPKSPPGDYKYERLYCFPLPSKRRVKHLNPRQGITNFMSALLVLSFPFSSSVKHLNPRQGITNLGPLISGTMETPTMCVKHLNPRQGITNRHQSWDLLGGCRKCETPKSPPGDYK